MLREKSGFGSPPPGASPATKSLSCLHAMDDSEHVLDQDDIGPLRRLPSSNVLAHHSDRDLPIHSEEGAMDGASDRGLVLNAMSRSGNNGGGSASPRSPTSSHPGQLSGMELLELDPESAGPSNDAKTLFQELDKNQDGVVDMSEIVARLKEDGLPVHPEAVQRLMREIHSNRTPTPLSPRGKSARSPSPNSNAAGSTTTTTTFDPASWFSSRRTPSAGVSPSPPAASATAAAASGTAVPPSGSTEESERKGKGTGASSERPKRNPFQPTAGGGVGPGAAASEADCTADITREEFEQFVLKRKAVLAESFLKLAAGGRKPQQASEQQQQQQPSSSTTSNPGAERGAENNKATTPVSTRIATVLRHFTPASSDSKGEKKKSNGSSGGGGASLPSEASLPPPTLTASFTKDELKAAALAAGTRLSDAEATAIIERLDRNNDRKVTFEEYVRCLLFAPEVSVDPFYHRWLESVAIDGVPASVALAIQLTGSRDSVVVKTQRQSGTNSAGILSVSSPQENSIWYETGKKLFIGGVAGIASRTTTAPIDRMRILMMTSSRRLSLLDSMKLCYELRGLRGFWVGNFTNCIKITPEMAIKLASFDYLKKSSWLSSGGSSTSGRAGGGGGTGETTFMQKLTAGALAGTLAETTIYPLDVVRTRIAANPDGTFRGIAHCASTVIESGGIRALYAGLVPSIIGIAPFAAIDLSLNAYFAERLKKRAADGQIPVMWMLGGGMISATCATFTTYPLYVLRTRLQAGATSSRDVFHALSKEGVRGFYRGMIPALAKVAPAASISFSIYTTLNERL